MGKEDVDEAPIFENLETLVATAECPKAVVVFLTKQQERKEVTFTKQPFGMGYRGYNNKVCSLKEFGHAKECGVEVGWCLAEIDGTVLTKNVKQTNSLLDAASRRLPSSTDSNNHV